MRRTIEAALGRVKERYGETQQPKTATTKEVQQAPEIIAQALEIMKNGDPIKYVLDVYNKHHAGDRETGLALLCGVACQSTITSSGLHPAINGPSGGGKSHAAISFVHLIPEEHKLVASISAKALLYMENLKSGTVVFVDDIVLNDELKSIMKRSSTFYQIGMQHDTVTKAGKPLSLHTPPRIMWVITSVDSDYGDEVLNRMLALDVVTTTEQKEAVIEHMMKKAASGQDDLPENSEVLICREIIRQIKQHIFNVVIPFANRIEWKDKDSARNLGIFLDLVGAFAVLRFMQRKVTDGIIEATEADFNDAKTLYKAISVKQTTKLTEKERKIAIMIYNSKGGATVTEMSERLSIPPTTLRASLIGKDGKGGMMAKIPGLDQVETTELTSQEGQRRKQVLYRLDNFAVLSSFMDVVNLLSLGKKANEEINRDEEP
jgi:hypothetical protein